MVHNIEFLGLKTGKEEFESCDAQIKSLFSTNWFYLVFLKR